MANTYTSLHYHVIFSTKNREPWIRSEFEQRIWAYLGGSAKKNKMKPLQIGGTEDHVHVLIGAPAVLAPAKIAQLIKGGSSAWIQETFPPMSGFGWQDGYGAFTVSTSNLPSVIDYIQGQREHHRAKTFQEEYRELLRRHEIEFDERYVWG
ncbi:MAG: IS200/IS605 family transposase [Thermoguttaceae bacterium]|jgi:REP element-mobilizing transposase RayT